MGGSLRRQDGRLPWRRRAKRASSQSAQVPLGDRRHQTFFGFSKGSCLALLGLLSLTGQGAVTDCAKKRGHPGADRGQQLAAFDEMATVLQNHPTRSSSKHVPIGAPPFPPRPSKSKTAELSSTYQSTGSRQPAGPIGAPPPKASPYRYQDAKEIARKPLKPVPKSAPRPLKPVAKSAVLRPVTVFAKQCNSEPS